MNNAVNKILIAEDSKTQAEGLRFLLEGNDYAVTVAANGKIALDLARQHKPELIISDIVMPEMDGYELCKAIKSDEALKNTPVILVTTLSDLQDVVRGLECGADNFIRKPYDESYLLSRINYLLVNRQLNHDHTMRMGVEIRLAGQTFFITSERQQILDLLISTYEQAIQINNELKQREKELAHSNEVLEGLYHLAEGLNRTSSEQELLDLTLEKLIEIPGVQAGWICMHDGDTGVRTASKVNLPPELEAPGILEMDCQCHRDVLGDELISTDNVLGCEILAEVKKFGKGLGDLNFHASVPLRLGEHTVGVINLAGPDKGMFDEDMLKMLNNIGYQVAVALERARLHERMEKLVRERTAKLSKEIVERVRIQQEQAKLVAIIEATPDMVATSDPEGHPIYINQGGLDMLGLERDHLPKFLYESHPDWAAKLVRDTGIPYALEHGAWSGETALLRQDGREVPVLQVIIAHRSKDGEIESLSTIARDISKQKEQADRITRLNRVYAVLTDINAMIVRSLDQQELFEDACRIAVEMGKFKLAWIGRFDADADRIIPVAWAGPEEGTLDTVNQVAGELTGNHGPAALAAHEGEYCVCNDLTNDSRMEPWREESLSREYGSMMALPLTVADKVVAVFGLCSEEKEFFDTEEIALFVEVAGDISFAIDHLEKGKRLNYLAYYDGLTGLPNRALFIDRLSHFLHSAEENGSMVAVLLVDLAHFHFVNEAHGRSAGDDLLKQVGIKMEAAGLDQHHLARISADIFAVILDKVSDASEVAAVLDQQIFRQFNIPFKMANEKIPLTVKVGIAMFPGDGTDAETLLHNAEAALKDAKLSVDKYHFYTTEINARVTENLALENKLRLALENEQFVLHYQPKVDLKSGKITGLEALIRWNDPDSGLVMPTKFIPMLEDTGMILDVGRWALEKSAKDIQLWLANGLLPPRVAVNVSQVQLRQPDFVTVVDKVLRSSEGLSKYLDLEITETLIMGDIESNIQKLKQIKDMGVEIAIDDFGTGYSSLNYIARLPINALKIDRAFIVKMSDSPDNMSIVSTIISLAHALNMTVIAEGVESKEQADLLRLLKCDSIQGFLFSRAVPADQIGTFLSEGKSLA